MSIQLVNAPQVARPQIFCDHCQKRIVRAAEANYQWQQTGKSGASFPLFFTHKRCYDAYVKANPEPEDFHWLWATEELTLLPYYLENNLDIDHDEVLRSEGRL